MKKVLYILSLFLLSFAQAFGQTNSYTRADSIHLTNTTKTSVVLIDGKLRVLRATAGSGTDSVYSKGSDGFVHLIKVTTGSFINNSSTLQSGGKFNIDALSRAGTIAFHTTAADSVGNYWHEGNDYARIFFSKRGSDMHDLTLQIGDNAHLDRIRFLNDINSADTGADNHDIATFNGDTTEIFSLKSILHNEIQFSAGSAGVDSLKLGATHDAFTVSHTDLSTGVVDFTSVGSGFANIESDDADGNFSSVVTNSGNGTLAKIQALDASTNEKSITLSQDSSATHKPGIYVKDTKDNIGLTGDELFDVSGDPNQYVQFGNMDVGATTLYTGDGAPTSDRTVDISTHSVDFSSDDSAFGYSGTVHLGAGGFAIDHLNSTTHQQPLITADDVRVSWGINDNTPRSKNMYLQVDTASGFSLYDLKFLQGIKYTGFTNFTSLKDSSLIPRKYAIAIMDSVKSTISGGGTTTHTLTFNNSGSGDASGSAFDGSVAKTLSYNSIGAQPLLVSGTNIKSINSSSILTSGNINLQTPLTAGTDYLAPTGNGSALTGVLTPTGTQPVSNKTFLPANAFQTAAGTAGTDSVVVKQSGALKAISPTYYATTSSVTGKLNVSDTAAMLGNYIPRLVNSTIPSKKTFTLAPVFSSVTASLPLAVDASKNLITSPVTGTGSTVVMSAGPTLTSPIINVSSDATGDIYYRNSSGLFTRLPVGATNTLLGITGGVPVWMANINPSNVFTGSVVASTLRGNTNVNLAIGGNAMAFSAAGTAITVNPGTYTGSSGQYNTFAIAQTYNGTSTESDRDFLINRTETALGSGSHQFMSLQVAGSEKFGISNTNLFSFAGTPGTAGQMPIVNAAGTAMTWVTAYTGLITGTPTIVAGTGAGTSPTVSVTTNGKQLQVTVTTGTLPTGTNATIATVTLPNALSYTPLPVFSSASAATALLNGASMIYMTSTGTANVTITSGTTALTAATTYVWNIVL